MNNEIMSTYFLDEHPPILDLNDIRKVFKLGRSAAYRLMNDKEFPSIRVGGALRITKVNLIKYLESKSS
jgi:predicted DNA-binding transcriptional regulator AlpA